MNSRWHKKKREKKEEFWVKFLRTGLILESTEYYYKRLTALAAADYSSVNVHL